MRWSGDCVGATVSCTAELDASKAVRATFAKLPPKCRKGQRSTKKKPCRR